MTAVTVRALPASCGDCLVVEYGDNKGRPYRILIDGGLKSTYDEGLGKYLADSPDTPTEFDIVVVSHIDLDHIEGVIVAMEQEQLTTDHIWFNGRDQLEQLINPEGGSRGARQGDALDKLIPPEKRNPAVDGKAFVVPESGVFEIPGMPGGARCTLLSPSRARLERLLKKWPKPTRGDDLKHLFDAFDDKDANTRAAGVFGRDSSPANGSSIAFLLEVGDAKLLLAADAYAKELEATIKEILEARGEKKLAVDLFKLSHHGSRQNMTDSLLKLIDPGQILVCTNGSKFKHPDADALQKIRKFYPDVPIHFTDNTKVIAARARSIGHEPPSADRLPVELTFGAPAKSTSAKKKTTAKKTTAKKTAAKKTTAKKTAAKKTAATEGKKTTTTEQQADTTTKSNDVRPSKVHSGSRGVKIEGRGLDIGLEWGPSGSTRGGATDILPSKLHNHQPSSDAPVGFELVEEAVVHEIEPRRRGTRGGGEEDRPDELVVHLGHTGKDEQRVVLVEENGRFGWFIPEPGSDEVKITATLREAESRGRVTDLVRRKVRVIALKGVRKLVGAGANAVVGAYEKKKHPAGLRTWTPANYRTSIRETPDLDPFEGDDRTLLIVHGFMGSIHGSFGFADATARRLGAAYDDRVIAYDHPTLTPTPKENASDLFARLEGHTLNLDILADSRGGLVAREVALLAQDTNINIRSIVFVASPNGGTPMADPSRPSHLLDAVTNFIGHIPGTDGFALVLEMLADIVFTGALPGLEGLMAMQPQGDYLTELNKTPLSTDVRLRAIATEFEPAATAGFLQAKLDDGLDLYFGQQRNDRIVPTASAYAKAGSFHVEPGQRLVLDAARGVHHSSFWTDPRATRQLLTWLSADERYENTPPIPDSETDPEVEIAKVADSISVASIVEGVKALPAAIRMKFDALTGGDAEPPTAPNGQRDAVIVLPGIMGTHLAVDGRAIWVDALRLRRGGLTQLTYGETEVTPTGLNRSYVPLINQLAREWDVHLFPYDWRGDIFDSADELAKLVDRLRKDHPTRGINFVAHSMGGLVVRAFVARHRSQWNELGEVDGAASGRLVMLGTPNRGSYSIPMTLLGSELAIRGLAAVDRKNNADEVARIVRGFPGVYQMLPFAEGLEDDQWNELYEPDMWGVEHIDEQLLDLADATHRKLNKDGIDAARFSYVAGYGKDTPYRVKFGEPQDGEKGWDIRIGQFAMGDGRVAHRLGELPDMPMFFVDATHGGLISDPNVLATIDDLVRDGTAETTERFLATPPARRGPGGNFPRLVPVDDIDRQPLAHATGTRGGAVQPATSDDRRVIDDALSMLLGGEPTTASRPLLNVSVVHASLEQTRHPVAVGHYARMPAEGAEGFLDFKLEGVLKARYRLGLDADEPGKAVVVRAPDGHQPGGALVVGLGDFGLLTESILSTGITDGVLRLARMRIEAGIGRHEPFGLSSVLIGTPGRFGLGIETSMVAIIEGVMRALGRLGEDRPDAFNLEFIELYEQQADDAAKVLCTIIDEIDRSLLDASDVHVATDVTARSGGRPGAPSHGASGTPWIRMQAALVEPEEDDEPSDSSKIKVSVLARQAQANVVEHEVDLAKIGDYVTAAIEGSDTRYVGQTLYELLLPHRVKLELGRSENIHLLVDEHLGEIPWELLAARDSGGDAHGALALKAGFLRQLGSLSVTRQGSTRPSGFQALVIGDPPTAFPRLPGARREAAEVAELLKSGEWDVTEHISKADDVAGNQWFEIDNYLHDAPYRVVHIAAHGIFEPDDPKRSGVVTGASAHHRLTALDFEAMSVQPDLVFLNCCHLGRLEAADAEHKLESWMDARHLRQPHKVAATVASQLMRNGVKAVVVAGWEVDDQAAAAFADTLYRCLLASASFGDAVRKARTAAFEVTGAASNTWGAYQCYGDPDFQLVTGPRTPGRKIPIVSDNQLIQNAQILAGDATHADDMYLGNLTNDLDDLVTECGDRIGSAHVALAIADAYKSVGDFKKAAEAYRRCFQSGDGHGELRAIEQFANLIVRDAVRADGTPDLQPFVDALAALNGIIDAVGETPERLSLRGGVYKKLAAAFTHYPSSGLDVSLKTKTTKDALDAAKRDYRAAYELSDSGPDKRQDPYSGNVWLQLQYAGSDNDPGKHLAIGQELLKIAQEQATSASGFWDRSQLGDTHLTLALLERDADHSDAHCKQAIACYTKAFEVASTFIQRDSVRTHLIELSDIFGHLPTDQAPGLAVVEAVLNGLPTELAVG